MQINIDTSQELSDLDRSILVALSGQTIVLGAISEDQAAPAVTVTKPAAKKTTPAKKATESKAPVLEVVPDAEPEPEEEAAAEESTEEASESTATVKEAVEIAMALVADERAADVKKIMSGLTAAKVSELEGDEIQQFIDAAAALPAKS